MTDPLIPFVPRCPECHTPLSYAGASHQEQHDCSLRQGHIPSDSVEWVIYSQYAAYPLLFGRSPWARWHIFGHLFFAIGNGYHWFAGELRPLIDTEAHVGTFVPWRTIEDEEQELFPTTSHRDYRMQALFEESRQQALVTFREEWARLNEKPRAWDALSEFSRIFALPENVSQTWLLAACDVCQMFLQGYADKQSLREIYRLIEWRGHLFARLGLTPPSLDETRMTRELLREQST